MIREDHKLPPDVIDRIPELIKRISKDKDSIAIGNRLLSLQQFEKPTETPETYADIFIQLKNMGVIDGSFCDRLVKMAKFRNRLVHLYWEIEKEKIIEIIQENLKDFSIFQERVVGYLKDQKEKEL